ncbi:MAG: hypothetical protein SGI92_28485 [Bryobacteraceae bacterium]|nr:hypothetical protein [Bryobacteraceae bacterium]
MVEHVEGVGTELEAGLFLDGERLLQGGVPVVDAGLNEVAVRGVKADGADLRRPERIGIDVEVRAAGYAFGRVADQRHTSAFREGTGELLVVGAGNAEADVVGLSGLDLTDTRELPPSEHSLADGVVAEQGGDFTDEIQSHVVFPVEVGETVAGLPVVVIDAGEVAVAAGGGEGSAPCVGEVKEEAAGHTAVDADLQGVVVGVGVGPGIF